MKNHPPLLALAALGLAMALEANSAVLVSETFSGDPSEGLQGRTPTWHPNLPGGAWVADSIIRADGQVNDGVNTDRGAYLDLGESFVFAPQETYTLTLTWTNLSNAILFAGFSVNAPNPAAQMQTQGPNFAIRARRITPASDKLATWTHSGGSSSAIDGSTLTPTTGTATLLLETHHLTNATFTVDGISPVPIPLSAGYRYLWIAYEDPTSGTSDARFREITLEGPAPPAPPEQAEIRILPNSVLIDSGQLITLEADLPNTDIYYTLDGSIPHNNSTPYTDPFPLTTSTTVRAVGIHDSLPGPIASRSYAIRRPIGTPNLLLIVGPGVGMGDVHCYGGINIATPALDALARDGIRFTQYTTIGPDTAASQYALFTGRVAARSGIEELPLGADAIGLQAEEWTLAESLRRRGYETAFVGEWLLGDAPGSHPNDQGFLLFHGLPHAMSTNPPLAENHNVLEPVANPATLADALRDRAVSFLQSAPQPFALVFQPPAIPAAGSSIGGPHGNRIEALDSALGRLLGEVETRGIADNTLVIFVSDSAAPRTPNGGSNAILRDGAGTTWEGGIRAPMIARLPGTLPALQMNLALLWQPDLFPTLVSLLGAHLAEDRPLDGTPRPDVLLGEKTRPAGDETAMAFYLDNGAWQLATVREGKWKSHLIVRNIDPLNTNPTTGDLLYDLHVNAEEHISRAVEQNAVLQHLQTLADDFVASLPLPGETDLPEAKPPVRAGISAELQANEQVDFLFSRPLDSIDDNYRIEHGTNLVTWKSIPITAYLESIELEPDNWENLCVRIPLGQPPFKGPRHYVRLRTDRPVTLQPIPAP